MIDSLPTSQNWTKTKVKQNSDTDKVKKHENRRKKKRSLEIREIPQEAPKKWKYTTARKNTIPGSIKNKQLCWVVIHSEGGM
jgi:hypothetical protein